MSIGRHSLHNYISSHEWYSCKQDIGLLTLFLAMTCKQLTREAHSSSSSRAMLTVTRNEVEYLWSKSSVHSRRACPLAQGSPALLRVLITLERRPVLLLLQWLGLLGLWEILRDWKKGQVTATSKLMWPTHETSRKDCLTNRERLSIPVEVTRSEGRNQWVKSNQRLGQKSWVNQQKLPWV